MTCRARKNDILLHLVVGLVHMHRCLSFGPGINLTASLLVDASIGASRRIPDTLFGVFFEEINHAGAGGLSAELVSNRGFEAGGLNTPSNIDPWSLIGEEALVVAYTELSSCFRRNKVALRIDVLCDRSGPIVCPPRGVGVYNPGFWGMNIEAGKVYKLVFYVRSLGSIDLVVSLAASNGSKVLATTRIRAASSDVLNWTKMETSLKPWETDSNSRLEITTVKRGTVWFDQVSLMPGDTHEGHGFRKDLFDMLASLKPRFIRFPGGCFVEGEWLRNSFHWKSSIGPWEERPGHFGDVWMYWTDDALGYFEFLQLAEDVGALPVWVINNGISHQDEVDSTLISPFVQDALDSIQFAVGDPGTLWGSARAAMGRFEPFNLKHVAIGNEDCGKKNYRGNYLKFYGAIKDSYPDIKVISNCDASSQPLDHPADFYDFHVYTSARNLFFMSKQFDNASRLGPKAFVSEYAVTGKDAGTGSLLAALAEGAFLIGLETNSDAVAMASYAPLFVNTNDRRWNPDAIVFDSVNVYGTPSFWVQRLFTESSGANLLKSELRTASPFQVASAVRWKNSSDGTDSITLKVVNIANEFVDLNVVIRGLGLLTIDATRSSRTVLTSPNPMDENSFHHPHNIVPVKYRLDGPGDYIHVGLDQFSITCLHLLLESNRLGFVGHDAVYVPTL